MKPLEKDRPEGHLTKSEYARHRGCSVQSITLAMQAGHIEYRKVGQQVWIEPHVADAQWAKNRTNSGTGQKRSEMNEYDKARTLRERANAEKAVLQVAEYKKTLIKKSEVEKQGFLAGQKIRQAIEAIPAKLGARLAAITDPHRVEMTLRDELELILMNLSDLDGHEFDSKVSEDDIKKVKGELT